MSTEPGALRADKPGIFARATSRAALWIPLIGLILGGLLVFVKPLYVLVGAVVLVFAYLLFFKIEIAVIISLLAQVQLGQLNYLGRGTAFHPNGIMGLSLIVGALCYFLFRINKIEASRLRPSAAFMAFFVLCCLSLLRSGEYLKDGVTVTLRLATALAIYVVLLHTLDSVKKVQWTVGAIVATQVWPTLSGILGIADSAGLSYTDETVRLGHSGVGVYLAMVLTLCLAFLLNAKTASMRLLMGSLCSLFAVGLFLSYGRAGWIGLIVALIVLGVMQHRKILFVLPVLVIAAILFLPGVRQRFSDISIDELGDRRSSTLAVRVELWGAAIAVTKSSPLIGVGYGTGRYRVGEYLSRYPWMIHNDYVSVLLETGLAGLILFLLWHGQWLMATLRVYRTSTWDFDRTLALGVAAVFIASLVMRLTDNLLLNSYRLYPICAMIAATLALPRIRAKEQRPEPPPALSEQDRRTKEGLRLES